MAKKEITSNDKEFSFDDLNKSMYKYSHLGERMDKSGFSSVTEYIHSGNYLLNACLTGSLFKGYPANRSIQLAGPPQCGKSFLLLNAIKNAQKQGYYIIFYDSENAVDIETIENFGIDTSKFRYEPVGTVEEFRTSIVNLTEDLIKKQMEGFKIPKIFVALDSAGNLATEKEIADALSGSSKVDLTRAKVFKSIFRILMYRLARINALFIFTNHIYVDNVSFIPKTIAGGGEGIKYGASITLFLTRAQLKEDGTTKSGIIVTVNPDKNRFAVPNSIKLHISFKNGMNAYVGLQDYFKWDISGLDYGTLITEDEFNKIESKFSNNKNIEIVKQTKTEYKDGIKYFVQKDIATSIGVSGASKTMVNKHTGEVFKTSANVFSEKYITKEILKQIDNTVIKKIFEYSKASDLGIEVEDILDLTENED